jgi:dienelactone hydrolase
MLTYINNSDTAIIVLHEIYGINQHIVNVCEELAKYKYDIIAPNLLYDRSPFGYDQEEIAYQYFMNSIGFESGINQIKDILYRVRPHYKKIYVLGYSIGATLAWLCSETGLCDVVVGFYGSRIRNYLGIVPTCPVLLFFPTQEEFFDVNDLIKHLKNVAYVKTEKIYGKHGFADRFSKNYDKNSSLRASKKIISFVTNE